MNLLRAMRIFVQVVDTSSFTKAAHSLQMARSTVTEVIQQLEEHLSACLIMRTTRTLTLTPEGEHYYHCCQQLLRTLDEVERDIRARSISLDAAAF